MNGLRARMGWGACALLLTAMPIAAARAEAGVLTTPESTTPGPPGPAGPSDTQPPEIQAKPAVNGVIKPPGNISRMPVIKPTVPSRMPVIPPTGEASPSNGTKVLPK